MSVRPTPDGAPRPAHRSRLAHVLRIGAERAASTEAPFLWDGNPATPRKDVCNDPDLKEVLYNQNGQRLCPPMMDDVTLLDPAERARIMTIDIRQKNLNSLMEKLDDTARLYDRLGNRDVTEEVFDLRWARAYKITDQDAMGDNLLWTALQVATLDAQGVLTDSFHIFTNLLEYYDTHGDMEIKVQLERGERPRYIDTTITRFDRPHPLGDLVLQTLVIKHAFHAMNAAAVAGGTPALALQQMETVRDRWIALLDSMVTAGFRLSAPSQNVSRVLWQLPAPAGDRIRGIVARANTMIIARDNPEIPITFP